ncbi:DUF1648 domain-containing protein [Chloroflexota bacterium]
MNSSKEPTKQTTGATLVFHWSYITLPVILLLLSIVLTACFYHRLPLELAYRFELDGSPDGWLSRSTTILWMLLPQFFLALLAVAITWGVTKLSILFKQSESTRVKPKRIILLMGNMVALPQIILFFAMLDIFIYNSYQIHIMPLWVFALIIMVLGGIILVLLFMRAMRRAWKDSR